MSRWVRTATYDEARDGFKVGMRRASWCETIGVPRSWKRSDSEVDNVAPAARIVWVSRATYLDRDRHLVAVARADTVAHNVDACAGVRQVQYGLKDAHVRLDAAQDELDIGALQRLTGSILEHVQHEPVCGHAKRTLVADRVLPDAPDFRGELGDGGPEACVSASTYPWGTAL